MRGKRVPVVYAMRLIVCVFNMGMGIKYVITNLYKCIFIFRYDRERYEIRWFENLTQVAFSIITNICKVKSAIWVRS
jgi:hypothetical protein